LVSGEKALCAWNGSDFVKVATSVADGVTTITFGSTGLTPSTATSGAVTVAGTLAVANGGTGLTAGTSGGVLAYTASGTLASSTALAANALVIGGGAGAAPSTTTTGTGVVAALGVNTGSAGAFVVNGGALGTPSSGTVTNLTGTASININGTVGATTPTTGAFTTLSGASSSSTATGLSLTNVQANNGYNQILLQGSGGSNIYGVAIRQSTTNTAVHGGDFDLLCADSSNVLKSRMRVVGQTGGTTIFTPDGTNTVATLSTTGLAVTGAISASGSSSASAFKTPNIAEVNTISATAATGTINYDITTQSVLYYTSNASANWTLNFRGSSGTSLNTVMQTGESISATFLVTQGSTAYYNSAVTIDGTSVTPKWQGGTAPTSGNASSIDSYTYVLIKTGSAAFTVLASQTKFA
jgi:hypothetical protein